MPLPITYFQGHELDAFIPGNSVCTELTTASSIPSGIYSTSRSRGAVGGGLSWTSIQTNPAFAPLDDLWTRWSSGLQAGLGVQTGRTHVEWFAGSTGVARLRTTSANNVQLQILIGGTYTSVGPTFSYASSTGYTYHCHLKGGASGEAQVYINSVLTVNVTGNWPALADITSVWIGQPSTTAGNMGIGEVIVQDTSTLASISEYEPPTSAGVDPAGGSVGTYADVDEHVRNDGDFVALPTAGDRGSFKAAARTQTLAYVAGVSVCARACYVAGGATSFKPYLYIGGTRYYGATMALTLTMAGYVYTWPTNPATGLAWTPAEANAPTLEWGWEGV